MWKRRAAFLSLIICAVIIAGCTGNANNQDNQPVAEEPVVIAAEEQETMEEPPIGLSFEEEIAVLQNETDSKQPEVLLIGEKTRIQLKENPTTGYSWNVTVTEGLSIIHDEFIAPDTRLVGAGGEHVWTLEAVGLGEQIFYGVYHRPWEPENPEDATYTVKYLVVE